MKSELINVRPDARKESHGCTGVLEREEWRPIKGYEGLYEVSSFGRVRSLARLSDGKRNVRLQSRIRKLSNDGGGYHIVNLNRDGQNHLCKVHRLVMDAFVPNPNNLPMVNHRNEDKTANYPDNMEWCDNYYNSTYGTCNARQRERKRYKMRPVIQMALNGEIVAEYESTIEAARETGYDRANIVRNCNGKRPTAYGFIWKFKE